MKLIPYRKIKLHTNLTKEQCAEALQKNLLPEHLGTFMLSNPNVGKLAGTLIIDSFKLRRIIGYRNSFQPRVSGQFKSVPGGTEIQLEFMLHGIVRFFLILWFAPLFLVSLGIIIFSIVNNQFPTKPAFAPLGMFVVGMLLMNVGFGAEYNNVKADLIAIFKGIE